MKTTYKSFFLFSKDHKVWEFNAMDTSGPMDHFKSDLKWLRDKQGPNILPIYVYSRNLLLACPLSFWGHTNFQFLKFCNVVENPYSDFETPMSSGAGAYRTHARL